MKFERSLLVAALALPLAWGACGGKKPVTPDQRKPVALRAGIEDAEWARLLLRYADDRGLVNYAAWKASSADREALRRYLASFAPPPRPPANGKDLAASLINGYNAATISWILDNYPTESIRSLPHSFDGERHRMGGRKVSLDEIEHTTLRPLLGFRVHAMVVCAARSCPPLLRGSYRADTLESQANDAMRRWLAREDLNLFLPAENRVEISMIFRWYLEDFQKAQAGLRGVLETYAPERFRGFLTSRDYRIGYRPYDWGLNDQGPHGRNYGGIQELIDKARNM